MPDYVVELAARISAATPVEAVRQLIVNLKTDPEGYSYRVWNEPEETDHRESDYFVFLDEIEKGEACPVCGSLDHLDVLECDALKAVSEGEERQPNG